MEQLEILPIRVRITAILRKELLAGAYPPGHELSLTGVAAQLGVSRTPVREAFQTLAAEGLLELRMNRGAVVVGLDEKFICDHFEMRILLEGEAAARAARRRPDLADLLALQSRIEALPGVVEKEEYRRYNQQLHTRIWQLADNAKLYQYLCGLWNGPSVGSASQAADHQRRSIAEHRALLACIAQGQPEQARAQMAAHVARSQQNILAAFRAGHPPKKAP